MRLTTITCTATLLMISGCTDTEESIKHEVEATAQHCPYEVAVGVELLDIEVTPAGDVHLIIDAPATIADSLNMASTLQEPERREYWLHQVLPHNDHAQLLDAVKDSGHKFIFDFKTSDGKTVTQEILPE